MFYCSFNAEYQERPGGPHAVHNQPIRRIHMNPTNGPGETTAQSVLDAQDPTQPHWIGCPCSNPNLHYKLQLDDETQTSGVFSLTGHNSVQGLLAYLVSEGAITDGQRETLWATGQQLGLPADDDALQAVYIRREPSAMGIPPALAALLFGGDVQVIEISGEGNFA
jgi:hypothetical protein